MQQFKPSLKTTVHIGANGVAEEPSINQPPHAQQLPQHSNGSLSAIVTEKLVPVFM